MMIESISILLIGLALLLIGSNLLVASTDNASKRFSISGFYASFFMIGIATSAPEIFIALAHSLIFLYFPVPTISLELKYFFATNNLSFFNFNHLQ